MSERISKRHVHAEAVRLTYTCQQAGVIGANESLHVSEGSSTMGVSFTVHAYQIDGGGGRNPFPGLYGGAIGRTAREAVRSLELLALGVEAAHRAAVAAAELDDAERVTS